MFWPCPSELHPGTPRMFREGIFHHLDGKAHVKPIPHQFPKEKTDEEFPLTLTTGRIMLHYQTGVQTRLRPELNKTTEPFLEIHPMTASQLGLTDKGRARIRSRRGEMIVQVIFSPGIREDTVFIPFHWEGKQCVNQLTLPELDPQCRMPEFKACAVRVTSLNGEKPIEYINQTMNQIEKSEVLV